MGGWEHDNPPTPAQQRRAEQLAICNAKAFAIVASQLQKREAAHPTLPMLCELHQLATTDMVENPGHLRTLDVTITGSRHAPPAAHNVAELLATLFAELQSEPWRSASAFDAAALALWRLNWIHPFDDGNGRTARAIAVIVLFTRLQRLPIAQLGKPTFLDHLAWRKLDYFDALEAADRAYAASTVDISALSQLLYECLRDSLAK